MESRLDGSRPDGEQYLKNYIAMLDKRDPVLRSTEGQESMSIKKKVADGTIKVS
tara:strand:+ start:215 stop:376 length:162 start_codon:yes stop_codon:yes gene_type:complete